MGSAREARTWYYQARRVLSPAVALHRMQLLTRIIRLLLTVISEERRRKLAEAEGAYLTTPFDLLDNPPLPDS